jgi:hypothetical protein
MKHQENELPEHRPECPDDCGLRLGSRSTDAQPVPAAALERCRDPRRPVRAVAPAAASGACGRGGTAPAASPIDDLRTCAGGPESHRPH